jgi:RimJ/RimL family protein N-acetyltransferase
MSATAKYTATEQLRDGRKVEIRALRPEDQSGMLAALERTSTQSVYRRFFGAKRHFSEKELAFFLNVDFINHVALVAIVEEGGRATIIAGGRYVAQKPGVAEVAFVVVDAYQGQGLGAALLRHLATIARDAGLKEFVAEVLPDNISMLKVFEKSGLKPATRREADAVHVTLQL